MMLLHEQITFTTLSTCSTDMLKIHILDISQYFMHSDYVNMLIHCVYFFA